jgi:hypothetical protein
MGVRIESRLSKHKCGACTYPSIWTGRHVAANLSVFHLQYHSHVIPLCLQQFPPSWFGSPKPVCMDRRASDCRPRLLHVP